MQVLIGLYYICDGVAADQSRGIVNRKTVLIISCFFDIEKRNSDHTL